MMKAKLYPNLISFVTVKRADWILKVSVFKNSQVLIVAHNIFDYACIVKCFTNQNSAADFIENLVIQ